MGLVDIALGIMTSSHRKAYGAGRHSSGNYHIISQGSLWGWQTQLWSSSHHFIGKPMGLVDIALVIMTSSHREAYGVGRHSSGHHDIISQGRLWGWQTQLWSSQHEPCGHLYKLLHEEYIICVDIHTSLKYTSNCDCSNFRHNRGVCCSINCYNHPQHQDHGQDPPVPEEEVSNIHTCNMQFVTFCVCNNIAV